MKMLNDVKFFSATDQQMMEDLEKFWKISLD